MLKEEKIILKNIQSLLAERDDNIAKLELNQQKEIKQFFQQNGDLDLQNSKSIVTKQNFENEINRWSSNNQNIQIQIKYIEREIKDVTNQMVSEQLTECNELTRLNQNLMSSIEEKEMTLKLYQSGLHTKIIKINENELILIISYVKNGKLMGKPLNLKMNDEKMQQKYHDILKEALFESDYRF